MRRLLLIAALVFFNVLSAVQPTIAQSLEIIQLRNRPAEQIIPIVQPMLDRDGALTGTGFQLMVRTSPANLAQIRQMVASLDRAARQLIIYVRQDTAARDSRFDARAGVVLTPGNSRAAGAISDTSAQGNNNFSQQVRTQEGSPAFIQVGTSQLVPSTTVRRTVNGVVVQDTATERTIGSGFYATPRVNGDNVFIDISTQRDTPGNVGAGSANISRTSTSLSGRLGEWLEVGGTTQTHSSQGSAILGRTSESGTLSQRVYLRVEEAR